MKLKSVLKTITETKLLISGAWGSKYEDIYLKIDYLGDKEEFSRALAERQRLEKINPNVWNISYNKAVGCIEIDIN